MRKLKYILILSLLLPHFTFAQDTLIKTNGDTLTGSVRYGFDTNNQEFVILKSGRKKERINLLEVRSVLNADDEVIRPVAYGGIYKMGKLKVIGYMSYYMVNDHTSLERFTSHLLQKQDGTYVLYGGKIAFRVKTRKFVQDCPSLATAVKEKKYRINDLEQLTKDYNACIKSKPRDENRNQPIVTQVPIVVPEKPIAKSLEQKLTDFATLLEYSNKITDKTDVTAMFNDVSGKLRRKESIPDYLKSALTKALKADKQLTELLNDILKSK